MPSARSRLRKAAPWAIPGCIALFALAQLVPYGRDHGQQAAPNPFKWASPAAEAVARKACYDCHSVETRWWWGVKVAPFSWLAQNDIDRGRRHVDFSAWNGRLKPERLRRALDHDMPPLQFTLVHPEARLTEAEKQALVQGFQASLEAKP